MKAGNCPYRSADDLPGAIPVFPLPSALLLPRSELPLNIFEPRYVAMIDAALAGHRMVGMIQPDEGKGPCTLGPSLCKVGCAGRITSFAETGDGRYMVTLTGVARFVVVEELVTNTLFRQCRISAAPFIADFASTADKSQVDRGSVLKTFRDYLDAHNLEADWDERRTCLERDADQRARHDGAVRHGGEAGAARSAGSPRPRRDAGRAHRDVARPRRRRLAPLAAVGG